MKKIKLNILFALSVLSFASCDDFLDRAPGVNLDETKVFTIFTNAEKYHNDLYSHLSQGFNSVGSYEPVPLACASDEADAYAGYHGTQSFTFGVYDGVDANISHYYTGIRKINNFFTKVNIIPFPSEERRRLMLGEAYFLRAFYFNEVVKRFGGMPIMTENDMLKPGDDLKRPRNSYKECIEYILNDIESAIENLPVSLNENEYGRATKGAAMALKSRVLLYAASPLWQKEMGKDLWKDAADAASELLDLKDEQGSPVYELYGSSAEDYAKTMLTRREGGNKEIIFYKHESPIPFTNDQIKVWAPKGGNLKGAGAVCPTQNFIELFEMSDGKFQPDGRIFDDNTYSYINNDKFKSSLYNPQRPYENRDPRFYKIILYHGAKWQGETLQLNFDQEKDKSGIHRQNKSEYTRTGYYVRKYLPEDVKPNTTTTSYHNWIYFRLAEVYLNYAEALNESLSSPSQEVYQAVNTVRNRSGVVDLPTGLSKEEMRERIWNERAIELCFEEQRWFDARRWRKAVDWFGGQMYEMEITNNQNGTLTFEKKSFYSRVYRSYMDLYPIPLSEIRKNPLYNQNPGW